MNTNLVVIFTDEQSCNTLGSYGNTLIQTPNIDTLAAHSIVFDRAYVTQPVCTSSRSSILTGLYPHSNGCTENNLSLPIDTPVLPELLGDEDYASGYIGKWHLGDELIPQHGFDHWVSIEDAYHDYSSEKSSSGDRSNYDRFLRSKGYQPDIQTPDGHGTFSRGNAAHMPEEHTKAAFVGAECVDFIQQNKDQQFILFANFLEPHMPFSGPRNDQYQNIDIPLPVSFKDTLEDMPLKTRLFAASYARHGFGGLDLTDESGWKQLVRQYWGLVSMVDAQIGKILASIENAGIKDRTIVVFTSDHGDMMGAHSLIGKCVMFEEAVRVPLMISIPESIRPEILLTRISRYRAPISQIDLVPTLLDLLGQQTDSPIEGYSLVQRLCGEDSGENSDVFIEWNGMNSGFGDVLGDTAILPEWLENGDELIIKAALDDPVRTIITNDGWKYSWSHRGEDTLFHLPSDPAEMNNRITDGYDDLIVQLRNRIENWQATTMDPVVFG